MRFHYGYFVLTPNGYPLSAGDDCGPTLDTYKPGGSMGVKNGKEGIVVGVAKDDAVKRCGFDVMVLIVEHDHADIRWIPRPEVIEAAFRALTAVPSPPLTIQVDWKAQNTRMVGVWNRLYPRPRAETFHEFLIEVPLKGAFGESWYKAEISKPEKAMLSSSGFGHFAKSAVKICRSIMKSDKHIALQQPV